MLVLEIVLGHAVVVDSAIRDEGTSLHYVPPGRSLDADPAGVEVYRETRSRTDRRREEGCLTVEMEAAALIAVARFRSVGFSQVLFAGDSLAGQQWDDRGWTDAHQARAALFELALDASLHGAEP